MRSHSDLTRFLDATDRQCWILKPRAASGSSGIHLACSPHEARAAADALGEEFVIEDFVGGSEYSAEGVVVDGVPQVWALTEKTVNSKFVETGHRMPAAVSPTTSRLARTAVSESLSRAGVRFGPFHSEFWIDGDEVVLGEAHARPGGDFLHLLLTSVTGGASLFDTWFTDLLGMGVGDPPPGTSGSAAIEYPDSARSADIDADMVRALRDLPGHLHSGISATAEKGAPGEVAETSHQRRLHLAFEAADAAGVSARLEAARTVLGLAGTSACADPGERPG
ncbi:ATP-grasp domain-containing protein [Lipingzhangella sp. LS1_29]|uniref:ATP-grasp domain-containing protein n=1 Tax=Lipingzhangella rawalii TaxID=2055835 RepID=A0ABU2H9C2_9ACTN|nr:ATP-grasp domain-containing protein [Lipingzhangella rawalii]MDS1271607.1 ATP-grasp domain-containing protein [Lipingzhangella rawalii]